MTDSTQTITSVTSAKQNKKHHLDALKERIWATMDAHGSYAWAFLEVSASIAPLTLVEAKRILDDTEANFVATNEVTTERGIAAAWVDNYYEDKFDRFAATATNTKIHERLSKPNISLWERRVISAYLKHK